MEAVIYLSSDVNFFFSVDNFVDSRKLRGGVYFVDSLPTTPSGKVKRKVVRADAIELFNKQQPQF